MKTYPQQFLLSGAVVCSFLALSLQASPAGTPPASGAVAAADAFTPDTTFTDDVTIATAGFPSLILVPTNTSQAWQIGGDGNALQIFDALSQTFPFRINAGQRPNALVLSGNRVGVGTAGPQQVLHAVASDTPTLRLEQDASSFPAQTWDVGGSELGFFVSDLTNFTRPFFIFPGAPNDSFGIDPAGNVGLGTLTPAGKLQVLGAGNQLSIFQSSDDGAVQFRLQTNSTNRRFVALNSAGAQQSQLVFGDNGAFDFLGATVGIVRMKILANGNVGIGTSTPDQTLSVNGNASKVGGGSWATFSDERLKNIKGQFKSGLNQVMKLQPIRYEYKTDNALGLKSEGEHIGFGAQEVQKIIPEAVTKNADGYLMIDNDPILWTMLNAIKEQNAELRDQSAQLKEQKAEIRQLKAQNKEIAQLKEQLDRLQAQIVLQADNQELPRKPALAEAKP